jgi:histone arginine demethylase JMJD6
MAPTEISFDELSTVKFRDQFEAAGVPLVVRGGAAHWPCTQNWSIQHLRDRFADRVIHITSKKTLHVGEHLDQMLASMAPGSTTESPPYLFRNVWLRKEFPELVAEISEPEFARDNWFNKLPVRGVCNKNWYQWMELFVGGVGVRYPFIHQDVLATHAWLAQISGRKRYWMWPPQAKPGRGGLAPGETAVVGFGHNGWNKVDLATDLRAAFPDDEPRLATLGAGDVIFIPCGWWHTVETLEPSINLSGNWFNASNWADVQREAQLKLSSHPKAFGNAAYMRMIGALYS